MSRIRADDRVTVVNDQDLADEIIRRLAVLIELIKRS
jgi:hypothetical protein